MRKLTKEELLDIERQMYNKARDIDVSLFNVTLDYLPKDFVYTALSMYQNKDGGYAHSLEIDNQNVNSTAYVTYLALDYFKRSGYNSYKEDPEFEKTLNKAFNYLYNRNTNWNIFEESNLKYACAERFRIKSLSNFPENAICGLTIHFLDEKKPYYKKALNMLDKIDMKLLASDKLSFDELYGYKIYFDSLISKELSYNDEAYHHYINLKNKFIKNLELNKDNYHMVLHLIEHDEFSDIVEKAFELMLNDRKHHGLWEASHEWGNLYPEGDSAKLKWLGAKTYDNIYLLKKFGRIGE